jgi:hypothetical protein
MRVLVNRPLVIETNKKTGTMKYFAIALVFSCSNLHGLAQSAATPAQTAPEAAQAAAAAQKVADDLRMQHEEGLHMFQMAFSARMHARGYSVKELFKLEPTIPVFSALRWPGGSGGVNSYFSSHGQSLRSGPLCGRKERHGR